MSRITKHEIKVEWGDCDPANIVFYPNYFAWFDAASHALIDPIWEQTKSVMERLNAQACPLAEASARFLRPSSYGQSITFESQVIEWEERRFTILHRGYRDGELLIEGREVRFVCRPHPEHAARIQAIPIPKEFIDAFQA